MVAELLGIVIELGGYLMSDFSYPRDTGVFLVFHGDSPIVLRRNQLCLGIDCSNRVLNRIDLRLVEIDFATLLADKGRDFVKNKVITFAVNVERCDTAFHFSFAIHTFHGRSGKYMSRCDRKMAQNDLVNV